MKTNQPTNFKEQSPNWRIIFVQLFKLLPFKDPKVCSSIHKSQPVFHILSQVSPIHILQFYTFKIHFNIILPSTPWSSEWLLSIRVCRQIPECTSLFMHATHPANLTLLDMSVNLLILLVPFYAQIFSSPSCLWNTLCLSNIHSFLTAVVHEGYQQRLQDFFPIFTKTLKTTIFLWQWKKVLVNAADITLSLRYSLMWRQVSHSFKKHINAYIVLYILTLSY